MEFENDGDGNKCCEQRYSSESTATTPSVSLSVTVWSGWATLDVFSTISMDLFRIYLHQAFVSLFHLHRGLAELQSGGARRENVGKLKYDWSLMSKVGEENGRRMMGCFHREGPRVMSKTVLLDTDSKRS